MVEFKKFVTVGPNNVCKRNCTNEQLSWIQRGRESNRVQTANDVAK